MPFVISLLFILVMTGMALVPETVLPLMVWPLLLALGNLALVLVHRFRYHTLTDEDMAPLLTAAFSLSLAIGLLFEHPRRGISFLVAFVVMVLAGVLWSVWRAFSKPGENSDTKQP